jgi:hypothetical protein
MIGHRRDTGLDALLDLRGQILVIDEKAGYWVKFVARQVPVSEDRPHGLDYSLTLHNASGERLLGFDNAHPIKGGGGTRDHRHRLKNVKPYKYKSVAELVEDFWSAVEKILHEKGAIP